MFREPANTFARIFFNLAILLKLYNPQTNLVAFSFKQVRGYEWMTSQKEVFLRKVFRGGFFVAPRAGLP